MKFATYRSVGYNYRHRRLTFKPQRTEEAFANDEGATTQPPRAVELILEQKPPVSFHAPLPLYSGSSAIIIVIPIATVDCLFRYSGTLYSEHPWDSL